MPAIHSDILVHWTGKDIGRVVKNEDNREKEEKYIQRLRDILRHGLWMTNRKFVPPKGAAFTVPDAPCLCFTELKLSDSEQHAKEYGWLGIGVKRPFLFNRGGRPMVYWGFSPHSPRDVLLMNCMDEFKGNQEKHWMMHFFQPMNSERPLDYGLYSESEWRIVFHDKLTREKKVKNPLKDKDTELVNYWKKLSGEQRKELRYLVPLDGWLAIIIYPSIAIKNIAQRDPEIRDQIKRLAELNVVEKGNLPVEMDFDLCGQL